MMISLAFAGPTMRMKRVVDATPRGTPRSTSGIQSWACEAAKRKSKASASPHPPPTACPLIMAMVACSRFSTALVTRSKSRRNWLLFSLKRRRRSSSVLARACGASAPAENTGGAPVRITTRGGIVAQLGESGPQVDEHGIAERVAPVGPIEGEGDDGAIPLDGDVVAHERAA